MKIDKIVFSCTEPPAYSSYWNMHSKLCKVGLGIEPVCLLFGKKANTDMNEEYGKVIEMETLLDLPPSNEPGWRNILQMTLSKFYHCISEPDTTWMTGDLDLLPLCKSHFKELIAGIPEDDYAHLNAAGISAPRCGVADAFQTRGSERHGKDGGFIGSDLPGHYHVSKGKNFDRLFFQGRSFKEVLEEIIGSDRFGMGVMGDYPKKHKMEQTYWYYWLAEENYTSFHLYNAMKAGQIRFHPVTYHNELSRVWRWNADRKDYEYSPARVKNGQIVDIHCCQVRPYAGQADALERLVDLSGLLK